MITLTKTGASYNISDAITQQIFNQAIDTSCGTRTENVEVELECDNDMAIHATVRTQYYNICERTEDYDHPAEHSANYSSEITHIKVLSDWDNDPLPHHVANMSSLYLERFA